VSGPGFLASRLETGGGAAGRFVLIMPIMASYPGPLPGPLRGSAGAAAAGPGLRRSAGPAAGDPSKELQNRRRREVLFRRCRFCWDRSGGPAAGAGAAVPVRCCGSGPAAVAAAAASLLRSTVACRIVNGSRGPGALRSGRGPGRVCSRVRVGVRAGARVCCRGRAGSWGRAAGFLLSTGLILAALLSYGGGIGPGFLRGRSFPAGFHTGPGLLQSVRAFFVCRFSYGPGLRFSWRRFPSRCRLTA